MRDAKTVRGCNTEGAFLLISFRPIRVPSTFYEPSPGRDRTIASGSQIVIPYAPRNAFQKRL